MEIQKIFSEIDTNEKLYSVLMSEDELALKNFSKKEKKREAYGNIDEQAPKDPYYHGLLKKVGAGAAIGGTGSAVLGSLLKNKEGHEALEKVSELNRDIRSSKFFKKDHFGDSGSGNWFDEQLKKNQAKHEKKIEGHRKEIEEIIKKSGKKMRRHTLGSKLAAAGTVAAVLGTGVYLGTKFGDNARRASKKDKKDVLVQAHKEYSDIEEKVYSVLMTEEELALFSEIQKEFARRDYENLNQAEADALRKKRQGFAKSLRKNYRETMSGIDSAMKPDTYELTTKGKYSGGGVRNTFEAVSTKGSDLNPSQFKEFHKNSVRGEYKKGIKNAKEIMRRDVLADSSINHGGGLVGNKFNKTNKYAIKGNPISNTPKSSGLLKKGMKWANEHRVGLGAAAGTAALVGGGAYLYNKSKKKDKDKDNNQ